MLTWILSLTQLQRNIVIVFLILSLLVSGALGPTVFVFLVHNHKNNYLFLSSMVSWFLILGGLFGLLQSFFMKRKSVNIYDSLSESIFQKLRDGGIITRVFLACISRFLFYFLFVVTMIFGSITVTTVMARFDILFLALFSQLWLADSKIKHWMLFYVGVFFCIVSMFFFQEMRLAMIFDQFILLGILLAVIIGFNDYITRRLSSSQHDYLPIFFVTSIPMFCGGLLGLLGTFLWYEIVFLPTIEQFLLLIFLGVVTILLPSYIQLFLAELCNSMLKISLYMLFSPIFVAFFAYVINGERLNYIYFISGFFFAIIGIIAAHSAIEEDLYHFIRNIFSRLFWR